MESSSSSSVFQPVLERTKTLLKVPFQALFQPAELEQDLHSKPLGKRVFWIHIVLTLVFYTVLTLALASVFKGEPDRWTGSLWIGIGIYLVSLLVAFVFGGVFKRDSHLSFLIGTYWGWIFGLLLFGMLATAQKNEEIHEIIILAWFPLFLAVSGALIANVRGRTGGIRVASYLVIAVIAGFLVMFFINQKQNATLVYMEGRNTGRGLLLLSFPKLKFDFSKIFLKVSTESVTYAVEREAESAPLILVNTLDSWTISESLLRSALKKNPTVREPAPQVMGKLTNLKVVGDPTDWNFSDVDRPRELFTAIEGVVGSDEELIKLAAEAAQRGVAVTIDGEQYVENYANTQLTFENENRFMDSWEKGQITVAEGSVSVPAINGLTFTVTEKGISLLRRDSQGVVTKSAQIPGTQVVSALMLGASRLYVQTDQAFQAFGIEHNGLAPLWRQAEQSWLRSVWGSYSSARLYERKRGSRAVLVGNSIYSISPSGYLFALAAEDGSLMFRRPLYDFTALNELGPIEWTGKSFNYAAICSSSL